MISSAQDQQHAGVLHDEEHRVRAHWWGCEGFAQVVIPIIIITYYDVINMFGEPSFYIQEKVLQNHFELQIIILMFLSSDLKNSKIRIILVNRFGSPVIEDWVHICSSVNAVRKPSLSQPTSSLLSLSTTSSSSTPLSTSSSSPPLSASS